MYVSTSTWLARWRYGLPHVETILELEAEKGVFVSRSTFGTRTYEVHVQKAVSSAPRGARLRIFMSTSTALVSGVKTLDECTQLMAHVSSTVLGCDETPDIRCQMMNIQYTMPFTLRLRDVARMRIPGVAMVLDESRPHVLTALVGGTTLRTKPTKVLVYRSGKLCIHARDPDPMIEGRSIFELLRPSLDKAAGLPITSKT